MISKNIFLKTVGSINKFKNFKTIQNFHKNNSIKNFSDACSSNPQLGQNFNISLSKNPLGQRTIFFDLQSTTPVDPRVLDTMLPYLTVRYGNPHSKSHEFGWEADIAVEKAREVIKKLIIY
jgi:selenocysteine lyase/cysteine desulfurase